MSTALEEKELVAVDNGEEITPERLLELPKDGPRYELIDGQLREHPMGAESSLVGTNTLRILGTHIQPRRLGKVFGSDCGYQAFPSKAKQVRYADGSFIARGRLPDEKAPKGHIHIAPDLGFEVVSPNDSADDIEARRIDFMSAGTRLFWVLYPEFRTVHIFRQDGSSAVPNENDELRGDDVMPEFTCKVAELFEDA